jgi:hypothetical protein
MKTKIFEDHQDPGNPGWAYRYIDDDGVESSGPIDDLDDLLGVLLLGGDCDTMDRLPTFGGDEPEDTARVWSWDEKRLLVGTCADDFEVVYREISE